MIFAATIVTFSPEDHTKVKKIIEKTPNTELRFEDEKQGKIVIIIEGEDNNEIENTRKELITHDCIESADFHAFHFGEEVEKTMQGESIKDFDFESAFKKHDKIK